MNKILFTLSTTLKVFLTGILVIGGIHLPSVYPQTILEEVDVQGNYVPKLKPRNKLMDRPTLQDTFRITLKPEYELNAPLLNIPFTPDSIQPQRFKQAPMPKGQRFLVKLGFGNYLTPFAEASAGSLRHKRHQYDLGYRYTAAGGRIRDRGRPGLATHDAYVRWNHRTEAGYGFFADARFQSDRVHYYGFRLTDYPHLNPPDYRQTYHHLNLQVGFESSASSDSQKFQLAPRLQYAFTADRFGTAENALFGHVTGRKALRQVLLSATLQGGFYHNSARNQAGVASGWVGINPAVDMRYKRLQMRVGAIGYLTSQPSGVQLHAVPDVRIQVPAVDRYFVLYAQAGGSVYRSSLDHLRRLNPFLLTNPRLDFTRHQLAAAAGMHGEATPFIQWDVGARFDAYQNMAFFINTWDSLSPIPPHAGFEVLYGRLSRTTLQAQAQFHMREQYRASLQAEYYIFHQRNPFFPDYTVPYHPIFRITARASVQILPPLTVMAHVFYIHAQTGFLRAPDGSLLPQRLRGTADINLSAEYRFNDLLSFWAGLHNIAAFAYNRWYGYPTQGFNVLGGIMFRF
ncbi:MAG: hypothetical protein N2110_08325 [Flavobacteriales bacterium]|nr:hypothetical protein [Flavobacteriales bacterium]